MIIFAKARLAMLELVSSICITQLHRYPCSWRIANAKQVALCITALTLPTFHDSILAVLEKTPKNKKVHRNNKKR